MLAAFNWELKNASTVNANRCHSTRSNVVCFRSYQPIRYLFSISFHYFPTKFPYATTAVHSWVRNSLWYLRIGGLAASITRYGRPLLPEWRTCCHRRWWLLSDRKTLSFTYNIVRKERSYKRDRNGPPGRLCNTGLVTRSACGFRTHLSQREDVTDLFQWWQYSSSLLLLILLWRLSRCLFVGWSLTTSPVRDPGGPELINKVVTSAWQRPVHPFQRERRLNVLQQLIYSTLAQLTKADFICVAL